MQSKRILHLTVASLFTALALILSYIEVILPLSVPIPGVKLGLANLAPLLLLYSLGVRYAASVALLRILLAGLLFGSPFTLLYSLAGGILALLGMILSRRLGAPVIAASLVGAALHNVGQITVACLVTQTPRLLAYLPFLLAAALVTGSLIGIAGRALLKYVPK